MAHLIVVVPCYNEAQRLDQASMLTAQLSLHRLELLFVNDGSQDGTAEMLDALCARAPERLRVKHLDHNSGKAEAVRQGMLEALAGAPDYIAFWDADLATSFDELPRFCQILESRAECHIVFGARVKLLGRRIERRAYRHYFGRVFATLVSTVLELPIYDSQCGAKMFRRQPHLEHVLAAPFLSRWVFDVEILARYRQCYQGEGERLEDHLVELPLNAWKDVAGSKVTSRDALRALLDLWRIHRAYP